MRNKQPRSIAGCCRSCYGADRSALPQRLLDRLNRRLHVDCMHWAVSYGGRREVPGGLEILKLADGLVVHHSRVPVLGEDVDPDVDVELHCVLEADGRGVEERLGLECS